MHRDAHCVACWQPSSSLQRISRRNCRPCDAKLRHPKVGKEGDEAMGMQRWAPRAVHVASLRRPLLGLIAQPRQVKPLPSDGLEMRSATQACFKMHRQPAVRFRECRGALLERMLCWQRPPSYLLSRSLLSSTMLKQPHRRLREPDRVVTLWQLLHWQPQNWPESQVDLDLRRGRVASLPVVEVIPGPRPLP